MHGCAADTCWWPVDLPRRLAGQSSCFSSRRTYACIARQASASARSLLQSVPQVRFAQPCSAPGSQSVGRRKRRVALRAGAKAKRFLTTIEASGTLRSMRTPSRSLPSKAGGFSPAKALCCSRCAARPNTSVNLTRYGRRRLAAPGAGAHCPSAASRRLPPRAGYLER